LEAERDCNTAEMRYICQLSHIPYDLREDKAGVQRVEVLWLAKQKTADLVGSQHDEIFLPQEWADRKGFSSLKSNLK